MTCSPTATPAFANRCAAHRNALIPGCGPDTPVAAGAPPARVCRRSGRKDDCLDSAIHLALGAQTRRQRVRQQRQRRTTPLLGGLQELGLGVAMIVA
ncbi:MAG: hypothetical protein AAFY24_21775, partial [Pseudomonadota bacterium]